MPVVARLRADTTQLNRGLTQASSQFRQLASDANSSLSSISLPAFATGALSVAGLTSVITDSLSDLGDFETGLLRIRKFFEEWTDEDVKRLGDGLREQAFKSGVDIADALAAGYQAASLGSDTVDSILQTTQTALDAVVASGGSASEITALLQKASASFGITTRAVGDFAARTEELGDTTLPKLARNLTQVLPFVEAFAGGIKPEEVFASFAFLTGTFPTTSQASTALRALLGEFLNPTTRINQLIHDEYGSFGLDVLQNDSFFNVITTLFNRDPIAFRSALSNQQALSAAELFIARPQDYLSNLESVSGSQGTLSRQAGVVSQSIGQSSARLGETISDSGRTFAEGFRDSAETAFESLAELLQDNETQTAIRNLGGALASFVGGTSPLVSALLAFVRATAVPFLSSEVGGISGAELALFGFQGALGTNLVRGRGMLGGAINTHLFGLPPQHRGGASGGVRPPAPDFDPPPTSGGYTSQSGYVYYPSSRVNYDAQTTGGDQRGNVALGGMMLGPFMGEKKLAGVPWGYPGADAPQKDLQAWRQKVFLTKGGREWDLDAFTGSNVQSATQITDWARDRLILNRGDMDVDYAIEEGLDIDEIMDDAREYLTNPDARPELMDTLWTPPIDYEYMYPVFEELLHDRVAMSRRLPASERAQAAYRIVSEFYNSTGVYGSLESTYEHQLDARKAITRKSGPFNPVGNRNFRRMISQLVRGDAKWFHGTSEQLTPYWKPDTILADRLHLTDNIRVAANYAGKSGSVNWARPPAIPPENILLDLIGNIIMSPHEAGGYSLAGERVRLTQHFNGFIEAILHDLDGFHGGFLRWGGAREDWDAIEAGELTDNTFWEPYGRDKLYSYLNSLRTVGGGSADYRSTSGRELYGGPRMGSFTLNRLLKDSDAMLPLMALTDPLDNFSRLHGMDDSNIRKILTKNATAGQRKQLQQAGLIPQDVAPKPRNLPVRWIDPLSYEYPEFFVDGRLDPFAFLGQNLIKTTPSLRRPSAAQETLGFPRHPTGKGFDIGVSAGPPTTPGMLGNERVGELSTRIKELRMRTMRDESGTMGEIDANIRQQIYDDMYSRQGYDVGTTARFMEFDELYSQVHAKGALTSTDVFEHWFGANRKKNIEKVTELIRGLMRGSQQGYADRTYGGAPGPALYHGGHASLISPLGDFPTTPDRWVADTYTAMNRLYPNRKKPGISSEHPRTTELGYGRVSPYTILWDIFGNESMDIRHAGLSKFGEQVAIRADMRKGPELDIALDDTGKTKPVIYGAMSRELDWTDVLFYGQGQGKLFPMSNLKKVGTPATRFAMFKEMEKHGVDLHEDITRMLGAIEDVDPSDFPETHPKVLELMRQAKNMPYGSIHRQRELNWRRHGRQRWDQHTPQDPAIYAMKKNLGLHYRGKNLPVLWQPQPKFEPPSRLPVRWVDPLSYDYPEFFTDGRINLAAFMGQNLVKTTESFRQITDTQKRVMRGGEGTHTTPDMLDSSFGETAEQLFSPPDGTSGTDRFLLWKRMATELGIEQIPLKNKRISDKSLSKEYRSIYDYWFGLHGEKNRALAAQQIRRLMLGGERVYHGGMVKELSEALPFFTTQDRGLAQHFLGWSGVKAELMGGTKKLTGLRGQRYGGAETVSSYLTSPISPYTIRFDPFRHSDDHIQIRGQSGLGEQASVRAVVDTDTKSWIETILYGAGIDSLEPESGGISKEPSLKAKAFKRLGMSDAGEQLSISPAEEAKILEAARKTVLDNTYLQRDYVEARRLFGFRDRYPKGVHSRNLPVLWRAQPRFKPPSRVPARWVDPLSYDYPEFFTDGRINLAAFLGQNLVKTTESMWTYTEKPLKLQDGLTASPDRFHRDFGDVAQMLFGPGSEKLSYQQRVDHWDKLNYELGIQQIPVPNRQLSPSHRSALLEHWLGEGSEARKVEAAQAIRNLMTGEGKLFHGGRPKMIGDEYPFYTTSRYGVAKHFVERSEWTMPFSEGPTTPMEAALWGGKPMVSSFKHEPVSPYTIRFDPFRHAFGVPEIGGQSTLGEQATVRAVLDMGRHYGPWLETIFYGQGIDKLTPARRDLHKDPRLKGSALKRLKIASAATERGISEVWMTSIFDRALDISEAEQAKLIRQAKLSELDNIYKQQEYVKARKLFGYRNAFPPTLESGKIGARAILGAVGGLGATAAATYFGGADIGLIAGSAAMGLGAASSVWSRFRGGTEGFWSRLRGAAPGALGSTLGVGAAGVAGGAAGGAGAAAGVGLWNALKLVGETDSLGDVISNSRLGRFSRRSSAPNWLQSFLNTASTEQIGLYNENLLGGETVYRSLGVTGGESIGKIKAGRQTFSAGSEAWSPYGDMATKAPNAINYVDGMQVPTDFGNWLARSGLYGYTFIPSQNLSATRADFYPDLTGAPKGVGYTLPGPQKGNTARQAGMYFLMDDIAHGAGMLKEGEQYSKEFARRIGVVHDTLSKHFATDLLDKNAALGGWGKFPEYYVDISETLHSKSETLRRTIDRGEIAGLPYDPEDTDAEIKGFGKAKEVRAMRAERRRLQKELDTGDNLSPERVNQLREQIALTEMHNLRERRSYRRRYLESQPEAALNRIEAIKAARRENVAAFAQEDHLSQYEITREILAGEALLMNRDRDIPRYIREGRLTPYTLPWNYGEDAETFRGTREARRIETQQGAAYWSMLRGRDSNEKMTAVAEMRRASQDRTAPSAFWQRKALRVDEVRQPDGTMGYVARSRGGAALTQAKSALGVGLQGLMFYGLATGFLGQVLEQQLPDNKHGRAASGAFYAGTTGAYLGATLGAAIPGIGPLAGAGIGATIGLFTQLEDVTESLVEGFGALVGKTEETERVLSGPTQTVADWGYGERGSIDVSRPPRLIEIEDLWSTSVESLQAVALEAGNFVGDLFTFNWGNLGKSRNEEARESNFSEWQKLVEFTDSANAGNYGYWDDDTTFRLNYESVSNKNKFVARGDQWYKIGPGGHEIRLDETDVPSGTLPLWVRPGTLDTIQYEGEEARSPTDQDIGAFRHAAKYIINTLSGGGETVTNQQLREGFRAEGGGLFSLAGEDGRLVRLKFTDALIEQLLDVNLNQVSATHDVASLITSLEASNSIGFQAVVSGLGSSGAALAWLTANYGHAPEVTDQVSFEAGGQTYLTRSPDVLLPLLEDSINYQREASGLGPGQPDELREQAQNLYNFLDDSDPANDFSLVYSRVIEAGIRNEARAQAEATRANTDSVDANTSALNNSNVRRQGSTIQLIAIPSAPTALANGGR